MTSRNEPRLRFKGFGDEWKTEKVSSFSNREDNKRVAVTEAQRHHGNVPYYGANGIQDYVDDFTHDGTYILIAEDGANSIINYPIYYVSGKIWVNNHAHVLSAIDGNSDAKFLSNMFKKFNFYRYLVGNGRYKLNSDVLMKLNLKLPSLPEQQHIGNFFSKLDHFIDLHSQKLEQLKKLKRGYLQKMFPQKGETIPRLRFSGFSGEWKEESLDKLVSIRTGNKNAEDDIPDGNYVFFDRSSEIKHLNSYDFDGKVIVYPGEGANFLPRKYEGKYSLHQRAYGLYDFKNINSEYLYQYLLTQNHTFLKYAVGTTSKSLRGICFKKVIVPCPSLEEQQRIAGLFSKIDNCIGLTDERIQELRQQKKAYLQKMFI